MKTTFGNTIKQLRIRKGLTQQQLADRLFVNRSSVANWEADRRVPDATLLARLSECFGVDINTFFSDTYPVSDTPNVILVDDEKIILTGGIPVLEQALPNAVITGFSKPSDAMEYAKENDVYLAFVDIEMGKFSGFDLCRELLKIHPRTHVVFLTAYVDYAYNAWDTGAVGFLAKPLTVTAVDKLLDKLQNGAYGR